MQWKCVTELFLLSILFYFLFTAMCNELDYSKNSGFQIRYTHLLKLVTISVAAFSFPANGS